MSNDGDSFDCVVIAQSVMHEQCFDLTEGCLLSPILSNALHYSAYFQVKAADNRVIQEQLNQKVWNFL